LAGGRGSADEHHDTLRSQCKGLQTEVETLRIAHNLLEAELTRLQPAYDLLKAENERLSERIEHLSQDPDAFPVKENGISPTDDQAWQEEQASLRAEIDGLHQMLDLERQNHQIAFVNRTAELERLSQQHRVLQDRLKSAEASCKEHQGRSKELIQARTRLESEFQSQVESQRCRHSELEEQLRREQENFQAEVIRRTAELDELSEKHRVLQDRLKSAEASCKEHQGRNEVLVQAQTRLESDHRLALDSGRCQQSELEEQLRLERQNHQAELVSLSTQIDELRDQHRAVQDRVNLAEAACKDHQDRNQELIRTHAQLESVLRSELKSQECRQSELQEQLRIEHEHHQAELIRRSNEFDELSEEHRVLREHSNAAELACKDFEYRNQELIEIQARLETALRSQLESARCRQAELEDDLGRLCTLRTGLPTPVQSLREVAEFSPISPEKAPAGPTPGDELESARAEIRSLKGEVGQLEHIVSVMTDLLRALGVSPNIS
jgi:chromosome segregation ATPase